MYSSLIYIYTLNLTFSLGLVHSQPDTANWRKLTYWR